MQIGIPAETLAGETRVAATPETVKKFVAMGLEVVVQAGAGLAASCTDAAYEAAGAKIAATAADTVGNADFVLRVTAPTADEAALANRLAALFRSWLDNPARGEAVQQRFIELHHSLRRDTARAATDAIAQVIGAR